MLKKIVTNTTKYIHDKWWEILRKTIISLGGMSRFNWICDIFILFVSINFNWLSSDKTFPSLDLPAELNQFDYDQINLNRAIKFIIKIKNLII